MKILSKTQPDEKGTSIAGKDKAGGKSSLTALVARLIGLHRGNQDVEIESVNKPANPAGVPTTVPDDDLLERTDFFACLLRNWNPKD